uniref:Uncharacterized protein n=1 Tax=Rhizophora mucronata TaxID=61149 RepID=A0A2P2NMD1_RHIMU
MLLCYLISLDRGWKLKLFFLK